MNHTYAVICLASVLLFAIMNSEQMKIRLKANDNLRRYCLSGLGSSIIVSLLYWIFKYPFDFPHALVLLIFCGSGFVIEVQRLKKIGSA